MLSLKMNLYASHTRKKKIMEHGKEKSTYGEYHNVLLTDEEYKHLQGEYSNIDEIIQFLDSYIEEKGYKSKSHFLAIKRWVAIAENENKQKQKAIKTKKCIERDSSLDDIF